MTEKKDTFVKGERFTITPGTGGYHGPADQWFEITEVLPDGAGYRIVMVEGEYGGKKK